MKKILSIVVTFLLVFTMICCQESFDFEEKFESIFENVEVESLKGDINLPTEIGELKITWESSKPEIISSKGEVNNNSARDIKVTLRAYMEYKDLKEEHVIVITVKGEKVPTITFGETQVEASKGSEFSLAPVITNLIGTNMVKYSFDKDGIVEHKEGNKFVALEEGTVVVTASLNDYIGIEAKITVVVGPESITPSPDTRIIDIINGENGTYTLEATVVAVSGAGFLLSDNTGFLFAYKGNSWVVDVEAGDKVKVSGEVTEYGKAKQFGAAATVEKVGKETVTLPTAESFDGSKVENFMAQYKLTPKFVEVNGTLAISGNYLNLTVEGTEKVGSLLKLNGIDASAFDGKKVTVKGFALYTSGSDKYLNIIVTSINEQGAVIPPIKEATKISEVINGENGEYTVEATVEAVSGAGFLLNDGTGYLFVYKGSGWVVDVKSGDKVKVSGEVTEYGKAKQFNATATVEKVGESTVTLPTAESFNGSKVENFMAQEKITPKFVEVNGALAISGNYLNLAIEGTEKIGSLLKLINADLSSFDGKKITVKGFALYTSGSDKYLNILVTSLVDEEGKSPFVDNPAPQPTDVTTIDNIIKGENGQYIAEATVVAVSGAGFLLNDGTGYLFAYKGNNWEVDLKAGDKVRISGEVTEYGKAKQFNSATYEVIGTGEVNHPAIQEFTASKVEEFMSLAAITPVYMSLNATLEVSGNYINLKINGTSKVGSILKLNGVDVNTFDGKKVTVKGYALYTSGSDKYLNIISTEITEESSTVVSGTVAAAINAADNTEVSFEGTVVAVCQTGFLVADETGILFVYKAEAWDYTSVSAGDKVSVVGPMATYGKARQVNKEATFTIIGEGATLPSVTDKEFNAAALEEFAGQSAIVPVKGKIKGQLVISGKYMNLEVEGTSKQGSLLKFAGEVDYEQYNGKKVIITGYALYATSSDKYINFLPLSIELDDENPIIVPDEVTKIATIFTSEVGSFKAEGVVVAIGSNGFILKDDTGMILVHKNFSRDYDVNLGDQISVFGPVEIFRSSKQFTTSAIYTKNGQAEINHGDAKDFTASEVDAFVALEMITPVYGKIEGVLVVSGNYFNLEVNGTTVQGSLDKMVDGTDLSKYDKQNVVIYGYANNCTVSTSANKTFINFVVSSIETNGDVPPVVPPVVTPVGEEVVFDFVENFNSFNWDSSYSTRSLTNTDLGASLEATFEFTYANKQSSTITDRPVLAGNTGKPAANPSYVTVTLGSSVSEASFELVRWTDKKKFENIHIEYMDAQGNWVVCSEVLTGAIAEEGVELKTTSLPENVNVFRLCITSTASSNTQVGLTSIKVK